MDERKAAILKALIEEYVETGQPVGSSTVARGAAIGVSSATVRNEMAVLEREGYVTHPHTSAGRVPTDKGYRHFVDNLARQKDLQPAARHEVVEFFATAHHALEDMLHETSLLLSRITTHAAVVVGPQPDTARIRSVQLVRLHETSAAICLLMSFTGRALTSSGLLVWAVISSRVLSVISLSLRRDGTSPPNESVPARHWPRAAPGIAVTYCDHSFVRTSCTCGPTRAGARERTNGRQSRRVTVVLWWRLSIGLARSGTFGLGRAPVATYGLDGPACGDVFA